jgi:hypothetical protein
MKLKELEDYENFPPILRKFQVETIGYLVQLFGVYKPVVKIMDSLLYKNKFIQIVDLCSGSGLPSIFIKKNMAQNLPFVLTDKFPQTIPTTIGISYTNESVEILHIEPQRDTLYTLYNAFHHFTDEEKYSLIEKFKRHNATLLIVEVIEPSVFAFVQVLLASTLVQLCIAPFIKPFSWLRLLFTYIIPINIITVLVDGIISILKSKSKNKYQELLHNISTKNYRNKSYL